MAPERYALGGVAGDILSTVKDVVVDPCLYPVAKMTLHLHEVISKPAPVLPGLPPPPTKPPVPGIGLCHVVKPLQFVTYVAERPWVVPLGISLFVGSLIGIGYMIGRGAGR